MDTDDRLKYLKELVKASNGQITEQIKEEIIDITRGKEGKKSTDLKKALNSLVGTSDILSGLSRIAIPDIVKDTIESAMDSALDSIKMSFTPEVAKYVDCLSNDVVVDKEIPRTVKKSEVLKIENGKFVQAFPNSMPEEKLINPEFKQMLVGGYKPPDIQEYQDALKNKYPSLFPENGNGPKQSDVENVDPLTNYIIGFEEPTIGTPESDFLKNFVGADNPSLRKEKIPSTSFNPAGLLKDSFKLSDDEVTVDLTSNSLIIDIKSNLKTDIQSKNSMPAAYSNSLPSWKINYVETGNRYFLNVKNDLKYSYASGLVPETSSYRFSGILPESSVNSNLRLGDDICDIQKGDDVFAALLANKLDGKVLRDTRNLSQSEKQDFIKYLKDSQKIMLDIFVQQIFSSINNNRLLKKVNFNSSNLPTIPDNSIVLNVINFIPQQNEELLSCNKNPHPLNFDEIRRVMVSKFSEIGISTVPNISIIEEKNPISESVLLGSCLLAIRLQVFEYVLKNLVVFDELGYSSSIYNGRIIREYVSIMAKKELSQLGIYNTIEKVLGNNYDFLLRENIIKPSDIVTDEEDFQVIVDKNSFIKPSIKFKTVVNAMLRKVVGFTKNLIGLDSEIPNGDLLITNKIYDVVSVNNLNPNPEKKNSYLDMKRLDEFKDYNQFLMLERYVTNPKINTQAFENESQAEFNLQISDFGCKQNGTIPTSLYEYSQFLYSIINDWQTSGSDFNKGKKFNINVLKNATLKNNINTNKKISNLNELKSLFESNQFKMGVRLSYVNRQKRFTNQTSYLADLLIDLGNKGSKATQPVQQNQEEISRTEKINRLNQELARSRDYNLRKHLIGFDSETYAKGKNKDDSAKKYVIKKIGSTSDGQTPGTPGSVVDTQCKQTYKPYYGKNANLEMWPYPPNDIRPFYAEVWVIQNKQQLPNNLYSRAELIPERKNNEYYPYDFSVARPEIDTTSKEVYYSAAERRYFVIDPINGLPPPAGYVQKIIQEINELTLELDTYGEFGFGPSEPPKNITPFSDEEYSDIIEQNKYKFYIKSNQSEYVKIQNLFIKEERSFCFFDDNEDRIDYYNSLIVTSHEVSVTLDEIFPLNVNLNQSQIYNQLITLYKQKKKQLLADLQQKEEYQLMVNKALAMDRVTNLVSIHSTSALSNERIENMFRGTKKCIIELINIASNIDNYGYKSEYERKGGDAAAYERDSQNADNPNGNSNSSFDITQFLITTPILILKGLANLTDPNIAIASQIVDAAGAGLLFPKIMTDDNGQPNGQLQYPGDPFILPTVLASMALLPVNLIPPPFGIGPPVTPLGMYFWALEPLLWKLPFFQNQAAKSEDVKKLSTDPEFKGLKIGGNFSCDKDQDDI